MLRRNLLLLLGLLLLAPRSEATWSIVCANRKTREVGVATATCLANFNLRSGVPVIYVGEGAAAAQSFIDISGNNRRRIFNAFRDTELTPTQILADLANRDNRHQTRQYGIVNFTGVPVTFTGTGAGLAANGVTGIVGDVGYAIQGNVLTGNEVVLAAERAFLDTKGDLSQRMMAAMQAARALGGDGRCSCSEANPTGCGVPPPDFTKSAHAGTFLVARVGDTNGTCEQIAGCATGAYYLTFNVRGNASNPDPVKILQVLYDSWRGRLEGRPDGVYSRMGPKKGLPIDGVTERRVVLELFDIDERPLQHGGATIEIQTLDGLPSRCTLGPVEDHGDGRYTFMVRAGTRAGLDRFTVRAIDVNPADPSDVVRATLYPHLEIENVDVALLAREDGISGRAGGALSLVLNRPDRPYAPYLLVACLDAGRPRSSPLARATLLASALRPAFPAGALALDEHGRAEPVLEIPPGLFESSVGARLEVTGYVLGGAREATNTVGVPIEP